MPLSDTDATLPERARRWLQAAPEAALPVTYQRLAEALELTPPRTIRRVALALEQLMKEDAAAGRPFIAALVVSRQGDGLPGAGFFELAVALGRFPDAPAAHAEAWHSAFREALAQRPG